MQKRKRERERERETEKNKQIKQTNRQEIKLKTRDFI